MIKKFIFISAIMIMIFSTKVLAKNGDIIGNIYSTDILAYINDVPVASYNIGGKTVVIIEDLSDYGVTYTYNDDLRVLVAYMTDWYAPPQKQIDRGKSGKIVGNIYETDIKTYVNGLPVQAYSLNGKIAVAIEDLCLITDESMEYSPYNMRCIWNSTDRTISLYFLYDNTRDIYSLFDSKPLNLKIVDDKVIISVNHFFTAFSGERSGDFNPPPSYPIHCLDQRVGTGFLYTPISIYYSDDEGFWLDESWPIRGNFYNIEAIKDIVDNTVITALTYEESLKYFTQDLFGTIVDRIDTDDCTFLYISQGTPHGSTDLLVRIDKDGSYKNYTDEFKSVSFWGTITFTGLKIENEQVTFRYDVDYVIDLKTGMLYKKS